MRYRKLFFDGEISLTPLLVERISEVDDYVRRLFFFESMGILDKGLVKTLTFDRRAGINFTTNLFRGAVESRLKGLRVEDVGRLGSEQVYKLGISEYVSPAQRTLQTAHYAGTMLSKVLRELNRSGSVSYNDFEDSSLKPSEIIQNTATNWRSNGDRQQVLLDLAKLEMDLTDLRQNPLLVSANPHPALRIGHFLSATLSLMNRNGIAQ